MLQSRLSTGIAMPWAAIVVLLGFAAPSRGDVDKQVVDGVYPLNSDQLPPIFRATGTFNVADAGITPDDKCLIITRAADFLSKDFLFEVSVNVSLKQELCIGLGDGSEDDSLRLLMTCDGHLGWSANLGRADQVKQIGPLRSAGPRILRIQRHGKAVTVSVGYDNAGSYEPDMSRTVADPEAGIARLSKYRAHLWFSGKNVYSRVRIATGAAASPAPPTASPPTVAAKPPVPANSPSSTTPPPGGGAQPSIELINSTTAKEGADVLSSALAHYPDKLRGITRLELVRYHDGSELRGYAKPKTIEGSYSATPASGVGGSIMIFGPYEKWDPGRYLVLYRIQLFSQVNGKDITFLDVCSGGRTVSGYHPDSDEFEEGHWMVMPIIVEFEKVKTLEYRLWPNDHRIALDRVYIYKLP